MAKMNFNSEGKPKIVKSLDKQLLLGLLNTMLLIIILYKVAHGL